MKNYVFGLLLLGSTHLFGQSFDKERDILPYEMERDSYKLKKRIEQGKGNLDKQRKELAHMLAYIGVHRYNYNAESFIFFDSAYRILNKLAIQEGITNGNLLLCKICKYSSLSNYKTADIHHGLAINYKNMGDYGKALFHYKCTEGAYLGDNGIGEIYQALGKKNVPSAVTGRELGRAANFTSENRPRQVAKIQRKLALIEKRAETIESMNFVRKIVGLYLKQGQSGVALDYVKETLKYPGAMRKNNRKDRLNTFLLPRLLIIDRFAREYQSREQYDSAISMIHESFKYDKVRNLLYNFGREYFLLGNIYQQMNNPDSAIKYYQAYVGLNAKEIAPHYQIADYYARTVKNEAMAASQYETALHISQEYLSKIDRLPFSEKSAFINNHRQYLDELATYANSGIKNQRINALLFDLVLGIKAAQLSSSQRLMKFVARTSDTTIVSMYKLMLSKKEAYGAASNPEESEKIKREVNDLEAILYQKIDDAAPNAMHWTDIKNVLTDKEAAVEIIRYNDLSDNETKYIALVLSAEPSTRPDLVQIGRAAELDNKYFKYYSNSILTQTPDNLSYANYWHPIAGACKKARHIYVSPDGVYFKLNLNTLYNQNSKNYLLEYTDIEIVLSTREIHSKSKSGERANSKEKTVILFGAPDFSGEGTPVDIESKSEEIFGRQDRGSSFNYLFGAKKEINTLSGYLEASGIPVNAITDNKANEESFKQLDQPGILHIATHGFFKEIQSQAGSVKADPMFHAGLVMAGVMTKTENDKEDGVVTAFEVSNLNFAKTELVVLSACETGLGEVQNGEGVFGLQRAFKIAGANNIIMSLWKVDDEVTQRLMTQFYGFWLSGMDVATAFYMAQNKVKADFPQPYFWGAFVIF
jgi:CHAT domain-containing protein